MESQKRTILLLNFHTVCRLALGPTLLYIAPNTHCVVKTLLQSCYTVWYRLIIWTKFDWGYLICIFRESEAEIVFINFTLSFREFRERKKSPLTTISKVGFTRLNIIQLQRFMHYLHNNCCCYLNIRTFSNYKKEQNNIIAFLQNWSMSAENGRNSSQCLFLHFGSDWLSYF